MHSMYSIFLLQMLIIVAYAQTSQIIRDYFVYKNVTRVVGFSCGDMDEDFLTMKLLNGAGISTAIKPAGFQVDVPRYLDTDRTLGVYVDMQCSNQNISGIFDESSAHRMFDYSYAWLIFGRNLNYSLQNLNDSVFSIVTDFAILVSNKIDYVLYDVYNFCKHCGGKLNVTQMGSWRENEGLKINLTDSRIYRRQNFHGLRAKAAGFVIHRPKNVSLIDYLESDSYEIMDNWVKFGYTLLSHVSNMFNFSIDHIEINRWEKNDTNGPLMGILKKNGADMLYFPQILTIERYELGRLILTQWPTRTCFMFRTIPAMKMKPWIMLKPFAVDTWCTIVMFVVITTFILSCILKLERVDDHICSISALITIGALCQQGFPSLNDLSASRIALIQITIFGLLVYNYYSAAIVSARLNEPLEKMNDSLHSLANSGMRLATEKIIFFDYLLRNPNPDVQYFKFFWNIIPEGKRFLSLEDGVERIKKGGFAYHADPNDIYPLIESSFDKEMICQLTEVHLLQPSELGLWCNLRSHFHEIAKIALLKISASGLRRREIRRRSARKPYCPTDEVFVSSVTIYEAAPILILLLIGMIISLFVFGIEHFIFHMINSKQESVVTPRIKSDVESIVKPNVESNIKPDIKPDIKQGIKKALNSSNIKKRNVNN